MDPPSAGFGLGELLGEESEDWETRSEVSPLQETVGQGILSQVDENLTNPEQKGLCTCVLRRAGNSTHASSLVVVTNAQLIKVTNPKT